MTAKLGYNALESLTVCVTNTGPMGATHWTRVAAIIVIASLGAAAACGPVGYVSKVRGAATAVDEARAVNAAKYAPYEWTRAVEYLHAARAEAAMADFQAANRFGRLAAEAASKAKTDAIRRAGDPRLMDEITAPPGAGSTPSRGQDGLAPVVDPGDGDGDDGDDDETPPGLVAP